MKKINSDSMAKLKLLCRAYGELYVDGLIKLFSTRTSYYEEFIADMLQVSQYCYVKIKSSPINKAFILCFYTERPKDIKNILAFIDKYKDYHVNVSQNNKATQWAMDNRDKNKSRYNMWCRIHQSFSYNKM